MGKKKLLSILMAGVISMSFAACGSNKASSSSSSDKITGTVTLKLAHNMDFVTIPDAVLKAAERLNKKYESEGKDLKIEIETDYQRINWNEYMQNILFATKNGEGPDIFSVSGSIPDNVRSGLLLDISDIDKSYFVEGSFAPYIVDGKTYAMPFDVPTRAIYYNKNILAKMGWSEEKINALPQDIAGGKFTWEQFLDLCKETQTKGAAKWGLLHRPGNGADFLDVVSEYGDSYYNKDGKLVVNKDAVTRFFQFIYDAANTTKITPQNLNQQGWDSINTMVGDGSAFAYYGPIYSATYVAKAANLSTEDFAKQTGFAVFPVSKYNKESFTVAAPQAISVNGKTKYPEICKELLKELYAGDSVDMMAEHGNTIFSLSSVKSANDTDAIKKNPILSGVGYMTEHVVTTPPVEGLLVYQSELFKQIVLLELGQVEPAKAFEDFKEQVKLAVDADKVVFE